MDARSYSLRERIIDATTKIEKYKLEIELVASIIPTICKRGVNLSYPFNKIKNVLRILPLLLNKNGSFSKIVSHNSKYETVRGYRLNIDLHS